jgi:hypothetical protein
MKVTNKEASELERVEWTHDLFNFSTPKKTSESNRPYMELQNDREANHAMQATEHLMVDVMLSFNGVKNSKNYLKRNFLRLDSTVGNVASLERSPLVD